jgi:hypothetical protein
MKPDKFVQKATGQTTSGQEETQGSKESKDIQKYIFLSFVPFNFVERVKPLDDLMLEFDPSSG